MMLPPYAQQNPPPKAKNPLLLAAAPIHLTTLILGIAIGWLIRGFGLLPHQEIRDLPQSPIVSCPTISSASSLTANPARQGQTNFLKILAHSAIARRQEFPASDRLDSFCDIIAQGFSYNKNTPSMQAAADLLKPWFSELPDSPFGEKITEGNIGLFSDHRVQFMLDRVPVQDTHILELGPLEAGHSYMLSKAGAYVTSIEGNPLGYLKTILVKDMYDLTLVKSTFGNFVDSLELAVQHQQRFDAAVAIGVIYHMTEPIKVLHMLSQVTDTVMIWTHYYHASRAGDAGRVFADTNPTLTIGGYTHTPHCYRYGGDRGNQFIGGQETEACLLDRRDLLESLTHWGFTNIEIQSETVDTHGGGAEISFLARRRKAVVK